MVPITCDKCGLRISDSVTETLGALMVTFSSPIMPQSSPPFVLCGDCGKEVVEFIAPGIVEDARALKREAEKRRHAPDN